MSMIRILIIEDDADIAELVRSSLGTNYEYLHGLNGLEGLQLALEGQPDIIVSDIMMPHMNGHEFIERLRKDPAFHQTPVIFLSALGSTDNIRKGYNLGAALYLTKPIDPGRFRRNVELFIRDHNITPAKKQRVLGAVRTAISAPAHGTPPPKIPSSPKMPGRPGGSAPVVARPSSVPPPRIRPEMQANVIRVRVLIADPDEIFLDRVRREWEAAYEVIPAVDGIEAMERAARYNPDVFVIDGQITKMNGYQLVMMLRKNAMYKTAPIIFTTDKTELRDQQYIEKLGVKHMLAKPYELGSLQNMVARATSEPDFQVRTNRMSYRQCLIDMSLYEEIGTQEGQLRRVSQIMRAEAHKEPPGHGVS